MTIPTRCDSICKLHKFVYYINQEVNIEIKKYNSRQELNHDLSELKYINFLYENLDKFRDDKPSISKAIDYAFSDQPGKGGFLLAGFVEQKLVAAVVMNRTGMSQYIPENILVYVAVDQDLRGKGLGGKIISEALNLTEGSTALHVEYDNPAKRLYERLGFRSKYAEMRFSKNG